jgi:hypothetical protein
MVEMSFCDLIGVEVNRLMLFNAPQKSRIRLLITRKFCGSTKSSTLTSHVDVFWGMVVFGFVRVAFKWLHIRLQLISNMCSGPLKGATVPVQGLVQWAKAFGSSRARPAP